MLGLLLVLLAAPPGECRLNPALEQARVSIEGERPTAALADIHQAHMRRGNCRAQVIENYRLKAMIESLLGDKDRCRKAIEVLLAIDPKFALPKVSKEGLRDCYADAAQGPKDKRALGVTLGRTAKKDGELQLPLTLIDSLGIVDHARVYFRVKGSGRYAAIDFLPSESKDAAIPLLLGPKNAAASIEVIVHLLDAWDGVLFELGTAESPLPIG
jgi:hypothetical protein